MARHPVVQFTMVYSWKCFWFYSAGLFLKSGAFHSSVLITGFSSETTGISAVPRKAAWSSQLWPRALILNLSSGENGNRKTTISIYSIKMFICAALAITNVLELLLKIELTKCIRNDRKLYNGQLLVFLDNNVFKDFFCCAQNPNYG